MRHIAGWPKACVVRVVRRSRRHHVVVRERESVIHRTRQAASIHCHAQSPANARVVEWGGRRKKHQFDVAIGRNGTDAQIRRIVKLRRKRLGHLWREIQFSIFDAQRENVLIGHERYVDAIDVRLPTKIQRVGTQDDQAAAVPPFERVRPGAHRGRFEGGVREIVHVFEHVLRQNRTVLSADKEFGGCIGPGRAQVQHDALWIGRVETIDDRIDGGFHEVRFRIAHPPQRVRNVCRSERNAVLPAHVRAQMIGNRLAVGTDASVRLRRHLACEIRRYVPPLVDHAQRAEDRLFQVVFIKLDRVQRIERIRLLDEAYAQRSLRLRIRWGGVR